MLEILDLINIYGVPYVIVVVFLYLVLKGRIK